MDTSFHIDSPMGFLQVPHLEQDLRDDWAQECSSFPFTFMLIRDGIQAPSLMGSRALCITLAPSPLPCVLLTPAPITTSNQRHPLT